MRNDLIGSWGIYSWFPELGDDFVAPDSLGVAKPIKLYGKLFNCLGVCNEYLILGYRDCEISVRPDLYVAVQSPCFEFLDEVKVVATGKSGVVIDIEWHHKKGEPIFYLEFCGRKSSRQYFTPELVFAK